MALYIHIYAVGGESWPKKRGGILAILPFPLQNGAFFEGESWPKSSWRKTGCFGQDSPPTVTRFPPMDFSLANASSSTSRFAPKPLFLQWFRAMKAHFQSPPQNHPKGLIQTVLLSEVGFEGEIFVHFTLFFWLVFFVVPFSPLRTMEALETPCFVVFLFFLFFQNFRLPEPLPDDDFVDLDPFSIFRLKNAKKNSETGAKRVAWIPSSFSPRVYSFFCGKISFPLQTLFWPQKGYCPETPIFLVFSRRQPCLKQIP